MKESASLAFFSCLILHSSSFQRTVAFYSGGDVVMRSLAALFVLAGLSLGLAGCGGGSKKVETPTDTVPPAPVSKNKPPPSATQK